MPSAWRKMDNTIMIRTNALVESNTAGNTVSSVMMIRICILSEYD